MDQAFIGENEKERKRLQFLMERITDEELDLVMWQGWTIAATFAHLAFWDQRSLALVKKWAKSGAAHSPIDNDVTNDALLPILRAISSRQAVKLAVDAAEAIDRELEKASDELIADMAKLGDRFRLYRCEHRKIHLDQIEKLLSAHRGKA